MPKESLFDLQPSRLDNCVVIFPFCYSTSCIHKIPKTFSSFLKLGSLWVDTKIQTKV